MGISFDQPVLLSLLLPGLLLVVVVWRGSRAYLPPVRRYAVLVLRLLAVSLLILAVSGPTLRLNTNDLAVAVLLDRSASITPAERAQEEDWVARALAAAKGASDQVAVIGFAGTAALERPLAAEATPPVYPEDNTLDASRTDIAKALEFGLGVLPPDAARRIVLLSDGNENSGRAEQAAAVVRQAGVQVFTVALQGARGPRALVEALDAPSRVNQGDSFTVTAQVRATQAMPASLALPNRARGTVASPCRNNCWRPSGAGIDEWGRSDGCVQSPGWPSSPPAGSVRSGPTLVLPVALVVPHILIGIPLVFAWRRGGNLALPVGAHAVIDAVRDGLAAAV